MEDNYQFLGRCPVCGKGEIVSSDYGWHCNSISQSGKQCGFILYRVMHGKEMCASTLRMIMDFRY